MRNLIVAAALAAVAGPAIAQGQTKIDIRRTGPDTVRMFRAQITSDQARTLWAELSSLIEKNVKNNDLLVREMRSSSPDAKRVTALQDELERTAWVLLPKQSAFAMACAMLRRVNGEVMGTLGLQLHDSVNWVHIIDSQGGESLTMVLSGPAKIAAVDPGSPAGNSGIQIGDILISINGRPLVDSVNFNELLKPGSLVSARVNRGGRDLDVMPMKVVKKTSDYPAECNNAKQFNFTTPFFGGPAGGGVIAISPPRGVERSALPSMPPGGNIQLFTYSRMKVLYGGATLQPLDDDWRDLSGLQGEGLIVTDLPDDSPAATAGLRRFDLIKLVNNEPVTTAAAFQKIARVELKLTFTVYNKKTGTRTVTMVSRR